MRVCVCVCVCVHAQYIDYLIDVGKLEEAAERLAQIVNDDHFVSKQGKSKHEMWLRLCDLISNNPEAGRHLKVNAIIRQGLARFSDQVGRLWTSLANYYIRLGNFEQARDVFEEALNAVITVRDFAHVWDAYTQFEDGCMRAYMDARAENQEEGGDGAAAEGDDDVDFELRLARYEYLIDRRPLLLSSVMLRQNPHNVYEWQKRAKLYTNPRSVLETYTRALKTVDPLKATGKPHVLWVNFAKYYETHNDLESARKIFDKATQATFKAVDDLAAVWCEYAEFEIRHGNYTTALQLLQRATEPPARVRKLKGDEPVQERLFKSTRLWCFLADLTESIGTFDATRAVYDKILELRIATPQIVINYAQLLEEHKFFEESFKAYEKGVSLFDYPYSLDIWLCYLTKFAERYVRPTASEQGALAPALMRLSTCMRACRVAPRSSVSATSTNRHSRRHRRTSARCSTSCTRKPRNATAWLVARWLSMIAPLAPYRTTTSSWYVLELRSASGSSRSWLTLWWWWWWCRCSTSTFRVPPSSLASRVLETFTRRRSRRCQIAMSERSASSTPAWSRSSVRLIVLERSTCILRNTAILAYVRCPDKFKSARTLLLT